MSHVESPPTIEELRVHMRGHLERAAAHFGVTIKGDPIEGQYLRSVSAYVEGDGPAWLRVGREFIRWIEDPDMADHWTGIPDSNVIIGVAKPWVLASTVWDDPDERRRVRADLMSVLPGLPCSETDALRTPLDLPEEWWGELRRSVDVIRAATTTRYATRPQRAGRRIRYVFGEDIAALLCPANWEWETTHGDLHWANLLCPAFGLLDWELWGPGPVGSDAATLYLFSLLVPDVARRVHEVFADLLDSPAGRIAQVNVASRILYRATHGENTDLAELVRGHVEPMLKEA